MGRLKIKPHHILQLDWNIKKTYKSEESVSDLKLVDESQLLLF